MPPRKNLSKALLEVDVDEALTLTMNKMVIDVKGVAF
jgi:hypothetical protein